MSDDLWLRRLSTRHPRGPRVIFFPHAGGSAGFYLPAARDLDGHAEVLAVQYPGRQERYREPVVTDLHRLADLVTAALPELSDRPVTFFGHSMGATVAYEVAHRLEQRSGLTLDRFFASARRAPSRQREENVHLRTDEGILAEMRRLSGTDDRVLGNEDLVRLVLPAIRGDYQAIESYRPRSTTLLNCPISVLVGDADPLTTVPEARDWGRHTTGEIDVTVFPGGHFYVVEHKAAVTAAVRDSLRLITS